MKTEYQLTVQIEQLLLELGCIVETMKADMVRYGEWQCDWNKRFNEINEELTQCRQELAAGCSTPDRQYIVYNSDSFIREGNFNSLKEAQQVKKDWQLSYPKMKIFIGSIDKETGEDFRLEEQA